MKEIDIARTATFIETEGSISIIKAKVDPKHSSKRGFLYYINIDVNNSSKEIIDWLQFLWNTGNIKEISKYGDNASFRYNHPFYRIRFSHKALRTILPSILPYFVDSRKAELAKLSLEALEILKELPRKHWDNPREERLAQIHKRAKELNSLGKGKRI